MTYAVIIEPTAERGIREAMRYLTERQSAETAARWFNGLEKKVMTLRRLPARYPLAAESPKFPEDIRELLHGPKKRRYRILFTIRADEVHVLYIRHAAQDEVEP